MPKATIYFENARIVIFQDDEGFGCNVVANVTQHYV
jgi:hypothetical protein